MNKRERGEWRGREEREEIGRHCLHSPGIQSLLLGECTTPNTAFSSHYSTLFSTVNTDNKSLYTQHFYAHPLFDLLWLLKSFLLAWVFSKFYTLLILGNIKVDWRCQ